MTNRGPARRGGARRRRTWSVAVTRRSRRLMAAGDARSEVTGGADRRRRVSAESICGGSRCTSRPRVDGVCGDVELGRGLGHRSRRQERREDLRDRRRWCAGRRPPRHALHPGSRSRERGHSRRSAPESSAGSRRGSAPRRRRGIANAPSVRVKVVCRALHVLGGRTEGGRPRKSSRIEDLLRDGPDQLRGPPLVQGARHSRAQRAPFAPATAPRARQGPGR
jgi:hypothetical protein